MIAVSVVLLQYISKTHQIPRIKHTSTKSQRILIPVLLFLLYQAEYHENKERGGGGTTNNKKKVVVGKALLGPPTTPPPPMINLFVVLKARGYNWKFSWVLRPRLAFGLTGNSH